MLPMAQVSPKIPIKNKHISMSEHEEAKHLNKLGEKYLIASQYDKAFTYLQEASELLP